MLRFLKDNAPWLAAGGLLTFGSSFGQTYFISVFGAEIRAEFGLSHRAWASAYMAGTLGSAALMLLIGGVADRWPPVRLALVILTILSLTCLAMAAVPGAWALPFVIFGLRFCGQGMLPHLGMVLAGRWFVAARGRAVSIISLGNTFGEMLLPALFVQIMLLVGWRGTWAIAAAGPLLLMPLAAILLRRPRIPQGSEAGARDTGMDNRHWTRAEALRHWLFWLLLPGMLTMPVFGTSFVFQQTHLVEIKGWDLPAYFALYPLFPISSVGWLLVGGWAVDRFGAGRVMVAASVPLAAAYVTFALAGPVWVAAVGFFLFGVMMGLSASAFGSIWAEYFGTRHLGSIRAVAASAAVFGTAIGPVITGALIDAGIDYRHQLIGIAVYAVSIAAVSAIAIARARPRMVLHPAPG